MTVVLWISDLQLSSIPLKFDKNCSVTSVSFTLTDLSLQPSDGFRENKKHLAVHWPKLLTA